MNKEDTELHNIDIIIESLQNIKDKYGNLPVGQIFFSEDYPTEIMKILPCVVSNPINKNKYMVVFD